MQFRAWRVCVQLNVLEEAKLKEPHTHLCVQLNVLEETKLNDPRGLVFEGGNLPVAVAVVADLVYYETAQHDDDEV